MRSIREEHEEKFIRDFENMLDAITVMINDIRLHVLDGTDRKQIVAELEELEEALS